MVANNSINTDFSQLIDKRSKIVQQQQQNNEDIATTQSAIEKNSADTAQNAESISTSNGKIEGFNTNLVQVTGKQDEISSEVASLKVELEKTSDEDVQREINSKIKEKEISLKDLDDEINKFNEDLKAEKENLKVIEAEKDKLDAEKIKLDKEADIEEKKQIELENALKEVDAEIAVFKEIYSASNGNPDDITPQTIDDAFNNLEKAVLKDGVEIKNETKSDDGSIVREYSDGTKIYYEKGGHLEYIKPLAGSKQVVADDGPSYTEGWVAVGKISTSEYNQGQEDFFFFSVSDSTVDDEGNLRNTGVSATYMLNDFNGDKTETRFSSKSSSFSIDGYSHVKGENHTRVKNQQ